MATAPHGDGHGTRRHLDEVEQRLVDRGFLHEEPSSYAEGVHDALEAVTQEFVIQDVEAVERR